MAKCPICSAKKAKRKCLITASGEICSQCCGQVRQESSCSECPWFRPPEVRHDYGAVPAFTTAEMDVRQDLQNWSLAIENAIAGLDARSGFGLKDAVPLRVYELLIDRYHFGETTPVFDDDAVEQGVARVDEAIARNRSGLDPETLVKVLGVLRFVARRRSRGRREYLDFVSRYVPGS